MVVHQAVSLDGRIEGFKADIGLFYLLAQHWSADIHLVGSDTVLAAPEDEQSEGGESQATNTLAIVDSQGRVKSWASLQKAPFWGNYLSLCCENTAKEHLEYLKSLGVECWQSPGNKVDLPVAIQYLGDSKRARTILLDSGGTLSTLLFDHGLVDELSLLIHPVLVGDSKARGFYRAGGAERMLLNRLELEKSELLPGNKLWLRYRCSSGDRE